MCGCWVAPPSRFSGIDFFSAGVPSRIHSVRDAAQDRPGSTDETWCRWLAAPFPGPGWVCRGDPGVPDVPGWGGGGGISSLGDRRLQVRGIAREAAEHIGSDDQTVPASSRLNIRALFPLSCLASSSLVLGPSVYSRGVSLLLLDTSLSHFTEQIPAPTIRPVRTLVLLPPNELDVFGPAVFISVPGGRLRSPSEHAQHGPPARNFPPSDLSPRPKPCMPGGNPPTRHPAQRRPSARPAPTPALASVQMTSPPLYASSHDDNAAPMPSPRPPYPCTFVPDSSLSQFRCKSGVAQESLGLVSSRSPARPLPHRRDIGWIQPPGSWAGRDPSGRPQDRAPRTSDEVRIARR